VSIIVAATIMIILALTTIGFTTYVQREQQQAVDRQLSRQALYAAESGINETFKKLLEDLSLPSQKTDCKPQDIISNTIVSAENGVEYTCIQYDKNPTRLDYTVNDTDSKIIQLSTFSGNNFEYIDVWWGNAESGGNTVSTLPSCSDAAVFPASRVTTIPMLKFELTSIQNLNRDNLLANTDYIYFSPCNGGSGGVTEYSYNTALRGNVVPVACSGSDTNPCKIRVKDLSGIASPKFLARFRPVYASANVVLRGAERTSAVPVTTDNVEFAGQFSIDVTAKANDIVRRLRAAIPLVTVEDKPEAVLQTFTDVCKLLEVDFDSSTIVDTCGP
jgi:hypothetical protein